VEAGRPVDVAEIIPQEPRQRVAPVPTENQSRAVHQEQWRRINRAGEQDRGLSCALLAVISAIFFVPRKIPIPSGGNQPLDFYSRLFSLFVSFTRHR
ncbi:MAG: hypothetical protein ACRD4B_06275, partial [Acidobacteriota bacterium]